MTTLHESGSALGRPLDTSLDISIPNPKDLGPVCTTVEKASGRSRMLGRHMLYEANGGCAGEELKAIKYFIKLGFSGPLRPDKNPLLRRSPTPPRRQPMRKVHHHCFLHLV